MNNITDPNLEEMMAALDKSLAVFVRTAETYPRDLVRIKPSEIAFSATEIVYHMLDVERLWQRRIQGLQHGTMKIFQQMDPDKEARDGRYNEKEYDNGIVELRHARSETYRLVSGMSPEDLMIIGTHSKYGPMNTFAVLAKMEDHDRTHTAQMERTLRQVRS